MPVTVDFVTDFPVEDAGLLVDVRVLDPSSGFLFRARTEVHSEHGVRASLLQPFEEFVGIDHPVVVVEDFLPVVVISTETTRVTDNAVVDALCKFASLNLEVLVVEHVAVPKGCVDTEEATRDFRVENFLFALHQDLDDCRTFLSLDSALVGEADVVDLEATGSTFTTRLEVESSYTLEVEETVFNSVRRLVDSTGTCRTYGTERGLWSCPSEHRR